MFLMLNYTDITQNTYIQSCTVTEIMAREFWNFDPRVFPGGKVLPGRDADPSPRSSAEV